MMGKDNWLSQRRWDQPTKRECVYEGKLVDVGRQAREMAQQLDDKANTSGLYI